MNMTKEQIAQHKENPNIVLKNNGKRFFCSCGCNVFHHPGIDADEYECNSCNTQYSTKDDSTNSPLQTFSTLQAQKMLQHIRTLYTSLQLEKQQLKDFLKLHGISRRSLEKFSKL